MALSNSATARNGGEGKVPSTWQVDRHRQERERVHEHVVAARSLWLLRVNDVVLFIWNLL